PHARVGGISGLLEFIVERGETEDIPKLAERLQLHTEDLLAIIDAATLLGFAKVEAGDITVTEIGHIFADANILSSKEIFRQQALANAPLVATIYQTLLEKENHEMRADFFMDILDEYYPEEEAQRQFETAVDWGRYAELFEYDASERWLSLSVSGDE
ncbi:MAG: nitrate ABC transporter ATP-binding protein, partial [Phototrophicales bacterium]